MTAIESCSRHSEMLAVAAALGRMAGKFAVALVPIAILHHTLGMVQLNESSRPELWRKAFASDAFTENANARDRFKHALLDMEHRASQLANEIAGDLPEFTQHDISHAYALWEIANHISGPELALNPAEAYVLGGAILVHDLAMSRAAYQLSGQSLRARREWPDALAAEIRKAWGRPPHPSELASPPEELAAKADKYLLRSLHAEIAEDLPMASWVSLDKSTTYLISDHEIRQAYGRTIGRVAASHHWNSDEVTRNLASPIGAPGFAPINWQVDTLVAACLLRAADAAHLDATRAPDMLAAVRNLSPVSRDHWLFQSRVQRPYLKNGRLVFTAPDGFACDEIGAWWLAYETLSMVDEELRNTDSVLSDNGRSTFSARGVANVESPKAFSNVAPCRDWEPVEAKVQVGDVAGLVRRLGGNELYGENWIVGLREIVTNACDAVKAREALAGYRGGRPFLGRVTVWLEKQKDRVWIACNDNGIGMTPAILGGKLLDFGSTSWLSPDVVRDNPGLLASKFEPSGRFGIGFFSIFMLGKAVQVISRPVSGGPGDTWALEFSNGVEHRPILRKATPNEQLDEPGTTVRVQLDEGLCEEISEKDARIGLLRTRIHRMAWRVEEKITLPSLIRYLLPAPEIDIWASSYFGGHAAECAVAKQDWLTMDGVKLMRRVLALPADGIGDSESQHVDDDDGLWDSMEIAEEAAVNIGGRLQLVHDAEGRPAGRIAMFEPEMMEDDFSYPTASIITAGPARTSTNLRSVAGILLGKPYGAARESAVPVVSYASMGEWADCQMEILCGLDTGEREGWASVVAEMAWKLGRDARPLRCWRTKEGWLNYFELLQWIAQRSTVICVTDHYSLQVQVGSDYLVGDLNEDVLAFDTSKNISVNGNGAGLEWPQNPELGSREPLAYMFGKAVEEAWGISPQIVYRSLRRSRLEFLEAGRFYDRPLVVGVHRISRKHE